MQTNKAKNDCQWDNRILDFDGEDHVCIGRTKENSPEAYGEIFYVLDKVPVGVTMVNDEVWVPLAQSFLALEALNGNPIFIQISSTDNWSVDAKEPTEKHTIHLS